MAAPLRHLRRVPGEMSPKEEKRSKNQIVLDSDDESGRAEAAPGVTEATSATAEGPSIPPALSENFLTQEEDEFDLEHAACAFLRSRGYDVKETQGLENKALQLQQLCRAFHKLAHWVTATVPPLLEELSSALEPMAQHIADELMGFDGEESARRFAARYHDLLRRGRQRRKGQQQKPDSKCEIFMSELSQQLLVNYLGRSDMTNLLDIFFEQVRVRRDGSLTSSAIFCESAEVAQMDDAKKRKHSSSKTMPLPGKPRVGQDWRFCATGCDRDVRIFSTAALLSDSLVRLEGQRLGSHAGRVLSLDFRPDNEQLLSGGQDGCIQLWDARKKALTSTYRQTDPVWCLHWTPLGPYFVSSGKDGEALLWSVERPNVLRVYGAAGPEVQALRVQPDGRRVVVAHCDSFVFWDLASAMPATIVRCGVGVAAVTTLAFSPDGHMLAAGLEDGRVNLLDVRAIRSEQRHGGSSHTLGRSTGAPPWCWHRAHGQAVTTLTWSKVKTSSDHDVLFSTSGSQMMMSQVTTLRQIEKTEIQLAMRHDVLFSTSGSQMMMSQVTTLRQIEKTEIQLAMRHVLCSNASIGRTVVVGTQL